MKGSCRHVHLILLCMLAWVILGLCGSFLTCEGAPGQPWHPSDSIGRAFLSGIVETRTVLKASAVVHWGAFSDTLPCSEDFLLNLSFEAESIENAGHVLGERALEGSITVTLGLRYSPHDF